MDAKATSGASWTIPYEDLEVQDQIGGGGFCVVYRGFWHGAPVAIKKWFDPSMSDEMMQEFREEVMTHEPLRHPNVAQFLGACMRPPNLCLVMEHMPHSLHNVIYQSNIALDRKRVISLALEIARGFVYLHSRRPAVIHRDIKPANFLVDRAWRVKVCDFGLAANTRKQLGAGTPAYMAPELFSSGPYNEKVDVYAFGVVLNEMDTRQLPFKGAGVGEIKAAVLKGERPEVSLSCPKMIADIIKRCWDQDACERPTFVAVLDLLKEANKVEFGS